MCWVLSETQTNGTQICPNANKIRACCLCEVSKQSFPFLDYPNQQTDNKGASCSKLTMSLVDNLLKSQMAILQIHCYFLLRKCENPLHLLVVGINLTTCLNDDVKLTKFAQLGQDILLLYYGIKVILLHHITSISTSHPLYSLQWVSCGSYSIGEHSEGLKYIHTSGKHVCAMYTPWGLQGYT